MKSLGSKVQTKMETFSLRVTIDKKSHKRDHILTRGGVENTRLKPRTQKKSEAKAKDSPYEDRPSRGQGQECSKPRPRTEDPGASILLKKVFKIFFQAISKPGKRRRSSQILREVSGVFLNNFKNEQIPSTIGTDANAHHTIWGSSDINKPLRRGFPRVVG